MQNLIAFLTRYFHWLLFLVLEVASVVMLFRYNSYQGSTWVSSANSVAGQVYEWQAEVEKYFTLSKANRELTMHNLELERQLYQLRAELYVQTGDTMAEARAKETALSNLQTISAQVVHATIDSPNNLLTINRGSSDGVRPDMGVVGGAGIVGVVYAVSDHYALVLPVLNSRSRISCAIRGKDYFGYLTWTGGDSRYAYVEGLPRHARIERGEMMETNGYSAIFPPGITVGRVVDIQNSRDGLSYRLKVALTTDFTALRDVCVITDTSFAERRQLEEMKDEQPIKKDER